MWSPSSDKLARGAVPAADSVAVDDGSGGHRRLLGNHRDLPQPLSVPFALLIGRVLTRCDLGEAHQDRREQPFAAGCVDWRESVCGY